MSKPLTAEEIKSRREWADDFLDRGYYASQADPPLRDMAREWATDVRRLLATLDAAREGQGLVYLVAAYLETHNDDCHLCRIARLELAEAQQRAGERPPRDDAAWDAYEASKYAAQQREGAGEPCRTCSGTGVQPPHTHTPRCLDPVRRDRDCDKDDLATVLAQQREGAGE